MTTPTTNRPASDKHPRTDGKPAHEVTDDQKTAPADQSAAADQKPATAPEKPALELDFISGGAYMLAAELASQSAPVRARGEKQQAMDKKVKELHAAWIKGGRETTWEALVKSGAVATYFVDPQLSADLHKLINRAVTFHGLRVRMGTSFKVTEAHIRKFNLKPQYLGREAVSFAIMDKRPRGTSDDTPASELISKPADK